MPEEFLSAGPLPADVITTASWRAGPWWQDDVMDPGIRLKSPKGRWVLLATVLGSGIAFLDATVVNVALPTIGNELHATVAELQWIVNAYTLTLAGLILLGGSLGDRYGRRRVFVLGAIWFGVASALCATAVDVQMLIAARALEGIGGALLTPGSLAIIQASYVQEDRPKAVGAWSGLGGIAGAIGPFLGGWLVSAAGWRWVFLINLPIGIITLIGMWLFMEETQKQEHMRFDWFGFIALAIGIGSLQLLLDRGEQVGWFDSNEIWIEAIISVAGFYYFFAHSLTTDKPFVRFEMFKDRNFVSGCIFMVVIGVVLFGTMALVTPFMQNLLGYPIQTAGYLLGSRGVGTLITMMAAPRLMKLVHPRYLILCGLLLAGGTLYYMTGFSLDVTKTTIVVTSIIQGVGLGLLFVPISTVAFATLPGHLRTGATAITTLTRNIGSSIGISMVIANLTSKTTEMHARLTEQVTPFNDALQMPDVAGNLNVHTDMGRALLDAIVTQQAAMLAYINDFKLLMILTLAVIPMILIIGNSRPTPGAKVETAAID
jgi:DHA2 family multidrug resistance protein